MSEKPDEIGWMSAVNTAKTERDVFLRLSELLAVVVWALGLALLVPHGAPWYSWVLSAAAAAVLMCPLFILLYAVAVKTTGG